MVDNSYLVLFNAGHDPVSFVTPPEVASRAWTIRLDTSGEQREDNAPAVHQDWKVGAWTVLVLEQERTEA